MVFYFEGRSHSVISQLQLSLVAMAQLLLTGDASFSEQAWQVARGNVELLRKSQFGLLTSTL